MPDDSRLKYAVAITAVLVIIFAGLAYVLSRSKGHINPATRPTQPSRPNTTTPVGTVAPVPSINSNTFTYGFDFSNQAPDAPGTDPTADAAALQELKEFHGSTMDISMYGFGLGNPEPSPGNYNLSSMASRLSLIESVGGIPAITLIAAPAWMRGTTSNQNSAPAEANGTNQGSAFFTPPSPDHYGDFAELCAHVAQSFPQVKYFVVWNEMKGFFAGNNWDYKAYTALYNVVYSAIKKVRPDALIGGPYAVMSSFTTPRRNIVSVINGASQWGYLDQGMLDTVTYWLQHKAGADFIAVDGATTIAKENDANLTDPLTASKKYAAVDQWIRSQSRLPIWWMEFHIQPNNGWTDSQAAAVRIATLAEMAASGASVGLQWQPQEQSGWADQGLWTSTFQQGGGQPTTLAKELLITLPLLERPLTLVDGEPPGVLVGTTSKGALLVNTLNTPAQAHLGGSTISLGPGAVVVR